MGTGGPVHRQYRGVLSGRLWRCQARGADAAVRAVRFDSGERRDAGGNVPLYRA